MRNILIAVPCMDQVPAQFAQSLATLTKIDACVVAMQVGSLIYTSRENLAAEAIKRGADLVLWLDSDMMFAPDTLKRLVEDLEKAGDGAIITGAYYRRVAPFAPVLYNKLEVTDKGSSWEELKSVPDGMFEVEGCGFGCVLAPTDAFIDVMAKYGQMFIPLNGMGEDLSFCWRARQCGWRFVCDPSIPLGHVGHHVITRDYWEDYNRYTEDNSNNE